MTSQLIERLERRAMLDGAAGTIWSGQYSSTTTAATVVLASAGTVRPLEPPPPPPIPRFEIFGTSANDTIVVRILDTLGKFTFTVNGKRRTNTAESIVISADAGDDNIVIERDPASIVPVTIYAAGGNDTIIGSTGKEKIWAGDGDDVVAAGNGNDNVYGEAGNDYLRGGAHNDRLDGGDGADTLRGDAGNDNLSGGAQPDRLRGSEGNDTLHGCGGRDHLAGEDGDDDLFGNAGDDVFSGGRGADSLADFRGPGDSDVDPADIDNVGGGSLSGSGNVTVTAGSTIRGTSANAGSLQLNLVNTQVYPSPLTFTGTTTYAAQTISLLGSNDLVLVGGSNSQTP